MKEALNIDYDSQTFFDPNQDSGKDHDESDEERRDRWESKVPYVPVSLETDANPNQYADEVDDSDLPEDY